MGLLAHQRNTSWILPQTCNFLGRKTHNLCWIRRRWISWRRHEKNHTVTSLGDGGVNTDSFTDPRDWQTAGGEGLQPITPRPLSLGFYLVEWTCAVFGGYILPDLCYFMLFFFYGLVFAEALLWTFHRLGYVKSCCRFRLFLKWYCLPSVVDLSHVHYFSKVFPETERMCRAGLWQCHLIEKVDVRMFFITF